MKSHRMLVLGLSVLFLASGCQHAASPSLEMQQKFFSSLKSSNPEEERAWRCSQYYKLVGRVDLAVKELSNAVASDPHNARLLNALGSCYDRLGEYRKAQEMYERILAQDAGNTPARNNLGYSYFLSGDLAKAETLFQEILAKNPDNLVAQNNLGLVWCRQGKENKALSLWQKTEGDLSAREKLTQVLTYLGKPVETAATGGSLDKGKNPQIPVALDGLADKPEKKARPSEIARTSKKSVITRPLSPVDEDVASASVKTSKSTETPAKFPQEQQVKVEEVKMVIQPASYSPSPTVMDSATQEPTPTLSPSNGRKGKESSIDSYLSQAEADEPGNHRTYYRPKQWKRYWKPKIVTYTPQEPQKSNKSMKDYISKGYSHRNQSAVSGPDATIY